MSYFSSYACPIGEIHIKASEIGLTELSLHEHTISFSDNENKHIRNAKSQLEEYFKGSLKKFDLSFDLEEHSSFYKLVWKELLKIPIGSTSCYSEIAEKIGNPGSVRAVGSANAKNPIAIIIPCHRVIGKNGSLVGYAYGTKAKEWLLKHEFQHRVKPEGMLF